MIVLISLLFRCQFLRYPLYSILIINNNPILCLLGHIKLLPFRPISNLISNNTNNPGHSLNLMLTLLFHFQRISRPTRRFPAPKVTGKLWWSSWKNGSLKDQTTSIYTIYIQVCAFRIWIAHKIWIADCVLHALFFCTFSLDLTRGQFHKSCTPFLAFKTPLFGIFNATFWHQILEF